VISLESIRKAQLIAAASKDKKAKDVLILEIKDLSIIADYFVITSGESTTQVRAIVDNIEDKLREKGLRPAGLEGYTLNQWVLMDYSDVIAHIFQEETRKFYEIEKLWLDAPRMDVEEQEKV
jgi:ribosome-associated protein